MAIVLLCSAVKANATSSILLLGDSLSASYGMKQNQGWVYKLNQHLVETNAPYKIINASISGETTAGGLSRLPGILAKTDFDYLVVELGGNDGLRGFPADVIKNNLLQIIQLAKQANKEVFLMQIKIPTNYGPRYNKMFINVFEQVATETQTPLLPFFMEAIVIDPNLMQNDGIHPNAKAQQQIADIMQKTLKKALTE